MITSHNIYWTGLCQLVHYRAPITQDLVLTGIQHYAFHPEKSLVALTTPPLNRDGTPADSILYQAHNLMLTGFEQHDPTTIETALQTYLNRYAKLRLLQPDEFHRTPNRWFTGLW